MRPVIIVLCVTFYITFLGAFKGNQKISVPNLKEIFYRYGDTSTTSGAFFGYSITGIGDQNGDGYDDVLISDIARKKVYLFLGGAPMDTAPARVYQRDDNGFGLGVANLHDLNGNGKTEFAIVGDSGIYIYAGGTLDTTPMLILPRQYAQVVGAGDVNGDGYADVLVSDVTWNNYQGKVWLYFGGNPMDTIPDWSVAGDSEMYWFGEIITAGGDLNHDGYNDFAIRGTREVTNGGYTYIYFGGNSIATTPHIRFVDSMFTQHLGIPSIINDLNGDQHDELCFTSVMDTCIYMFFGKDSMTTVLDLKLRGSAYTQFAPANVSSIGDVNGDGYNDFLVGTPNSWQRLGEVLLYLGSKNMSGEFTMGWTGYNGPWEGAGQAVAWCGDVNHDGLNDIMFSCYDKDFLKRGKVDIYAGDTALVVSVYDHNTQKSFPKKFDLNQNYPNPFNPSTTVIYTVDKSETLSLKIFDIQGRLIKTIFSNMKHGKGNYEVKWDGKDESGNQSATGVYFYRLESPTRILTKKMIILR